MLSPGKPIKPPAIVRVAMVAVVEVALESVRDVIDLFQSGLFQRLSSPSIGKPTAQGKTVKYPLNPTATQHALTMTCGRWASRFFPELLFSAYRLAKELLFIVNRHTLNCLFDCPVCLVTFFSETESC